MPRVKKATTYDDTVRTYTPDEMWERAERHLLWALLSSPLPEGETEASREKFLADTEKLSFDVRARKRMAWLLGPPD